MEMALEKLFLPQKIRQGTSFLSLDSLKMVFVYFSFSPLGQAVFIRKGLRLLLPLGMNDSQSCWSGGFFPANLTFPRHSTPLLGL